MRRTAHYAVLKLQPYPNRTEHVNYGLIVFPPQGGAQVHLAGQLRKVRSFFPELSLSSLREQEETVPELVGDAGLEDAVGILNSICLLNDQSIESLGRFQFSDEREFNEHIEKALASQVEVSRPARKYRESRARLFTDVKSRFRMLGILAADGVDLPDHQVIANYSPDPESDVKVEFALQNGLLRLAQTIDLRADSGAISPNLRATAYSKAYAMDVAKRSLESSALETYVIVAGTNGSDARRVMTTIGKTTDKVLAWESKQDMSDFFSEWANASGKPLPEMWRST